MQIFMLWKLNWAVDSCHGMRGTLHNCNTGNVLGNCKRIAVTREALGIEELSRNGRSGSLSNISSGPESSHDVSFG